MSDLYLRGQLDVFDSGFQRGVDASQLAADSKWTDREREEVFVAIQRVARQRPRLTTQHVWEALGPSFPVTKGMTAVMLRAKRAGLITQDRDAPPAYRDGGGPHDHAQRLTWWISLVHGATT